MIGRNDILAAIEAELNDLTAGAPESLSKTALKSIREESIGYVQHVLDALSTQEMQNTGAFERFLQNLLAEARLKMHMR